MISSSAKNIYILLRTSIIMNNKICIAFIIVVLLSVSSYVYAFNIAGKTATISPTELTTISNMQLVKLNKNFSLEENETAQVVNYKSMMIQYAENVGCNDASNPAVPEPVCMPVIKLNVSLPPLKTNPTENVIAQVSLGESVKAFDATISFLNYTSDTATLVVTADRELPPSSPVKTPICKKIGTDQEGWYVEDELVKKDECTCRAACKNIGTADEGFYSTCTGDLIEKVVCSEDRRIDTAIGTKNVRIEQDVSAGVVRIQTGSGISAETAVTKEKLSVKEGQISIETATGIKNIDIMPEEAKATAINSGELNTVSYMELKSENNVPSYEIYGKKTEHFLFIFPYEVDVKVSVNAETSQVRKIK